MFKKRGIYMGKISNEEKKKILNYLRTNNIDNPLVSEYYEKE
jgi:hypothetical protein